MNDALENMSQEQLKSLAGSLMDLLKVPTVASQIVKSAGRVTPRGGPASRHGYYRESFATQLVPILNELYKIKKPILIRYSNYPRLTRSSIYQQFFYALAYYRDHMLADKDIEFRVFVDSIVVHRSVNGVVLAMGDGARKLDFEVLDKDEPLEVITEDDFNPKFDGRNISVDNPPTVKTDENKLDPTANLRKRIVDFIENAEDGKTLVINNLDLTDEQAMEFRAILSGVSDVIFTVTNNKVGIRKLKANETPSS